MNANIENQQKIEALVEQLKKSLAGEIRFDRLTRSLYSTDASDFQKFPVGVVIPKNTDDISATVELANQYQVPIIPRGGGSSVSGQTIGTGLVIDHSKYLNRILEINTEEQWAEVESGVVLDVLNHQLLSSGLMVGPDPSSSPVATIGGMAGNNSTGSHSVKYGMFADHTIELETILSDANKVRFKKFYLKDLDSLANLKGLQGNLYRTIPEILNRYQEDIQTGYPQTWRNVAGYGLNRLYKSAINENSLNLSSLVVGSEGTLASITKVKLGLVKRPTYLRLMVLQFNNLSSSLEEVPRILEFKPSAVELMSYPVLKAAYDHPTYKSQLNRFVEGLPKAVLVVEFSGNNRAEIDDQAQKLEHQLRKRGFSNAINHCKTPDEIGCVWNVRKAVMGLLTSKPGDKKLTWVIDDASVPVTSMVDYTNDVIEMGKLYDMDINFDAHVSAGCLHMGMNLNLRKEEDLKIMEILSKEIMKIAIVHKGTITGEHGEGLSRSFFTEQLYGPRLFKAFKETKQLFDPHNLFNPLKIVDSIEPWNKEWLQYQPGYQTPYAPKETYFDYTHWGGFQKLVEMCNGMGICRSQVSGNMCPSYRVTREERETTRGRANTLRNAMSGQLGEQGLLDKTVKQALDLCLECKACTKDCATGVDMARLKSEFLSFYQSHHGIPLRSRLFGLMPQSSHLASKSPALANAIYKNPLLRGFLDRTLKIDKRRQLPLLAPETFRSWFQKRSNTKLPNKKQVILWDDCHFNYHETHIGKSAVRVLETAGFDVLLLNNKKCCGRPLVSKGLLKQAKSNAHHNVNILFPYIEKGIPIIGIEPSCIATIKDEYPSLLKSDKARRIAENAFFFEEFITTNETMAQVDFLLDTPNDKKLIKVHTHCYQKAYGTAEKVISMLRMIKNAEIEEIDSGCCGMAGSFGYEKEHYEISMAIGELKLFPAIRKMPSNTIIAAAGTSCRQQIKDGTSRKPLHPIEILASALS